MARINQVKSFRGTTKTKDGNLKCGKCGTSITPGMSYMWWANRLPGSFGSQKRVRCTNCPPSLAERTPGRAGDLLRLQDDATKSIHASDVTETDEFESIAAEIAANVEEMADEVREAGENMESGFEHPTEQSENLVNCADELTDKAQELEGLDFDDPPEDPTAVTEDVTDHVPDAQADKAHEEYEEALESWRDDCRQKIEDVVNELELTY